MDRTLLLEHLEQADWQIAQGRALIAKQQAILADLARDDHDTRRAKAPLATLLESQTPHEQRRDSILGQLMTDPT